MRAAQINEYGDASVIHINEVSVPVVTERHVLVEIHASSLNPFDTMVRVGYLKGAIPSLPITLGGDIAGVVMQVGEGVTDIAVGDKVYGGANAVAGNSGAFAEYATTGLDQVAKMPVNLDFEQAGSLPLVGASALQAMTQQLHLERGQRIFIHGGGGGIGMVAIQIAKNIGAYVATTATGDAVEYVTQLGADEVIDYKTQNFSEILSEYDAVFDTVGGEDFIASFAVVKEGGIAVSMTAQPDDAKAKAQGITAILQKTQVNRDILTELTKLVEEGIVTSHVGRVFPLTDIRQAFETREEGGINGKIVIKMK